jgi:hypothetical protein
MVSLAVRFLGAKPVTCEARPLLYRSHAALDRGSYIEAGCRLREAARLYLVAQCEHHGVTLSKRKVRQTPRAMLDALHRQGVYGAYSHSLIANAIDVGNRAAHCQFVQPAEIEEALDILHWALDDATHFVQPIAVGRWS